MDRFNEGLPSSDASENSGGSEDEGDGDEAEDDDAESTGEQYIPAGGGADQKQSAPFLTDFADDKGNILTHSHLHLQCPCLSRARPCFVAPHTLVKQWRRIQQR